MSDWVKFGPKSTTETEIAALRRRVDMRVHTSLLDAKPGDVLLFQTSGPEATAKDQRALMDSISRCGVSGVQIVMLPSGSTLTKMTRGEMRALHKKLGMLLKPTARRRRR